MKTALLLLLLAAAPLARADEGDKPGQHFFVVPSPSNRFHVVQTVRPWQKADQIAQFGRLQVFATETGQEVWRLDGALYAENEVYPADDGEHLVLLRARVFGGKSPADLDAPVVSFYARNRLLRSYTLRDLKVDLAKAERSVSHFTWLSARPVSLAWEWEWPLGTEDARINTLGNKPNPRWEKDAFELEAMDGQVFRFDPATGGQLPAAGK